MEEERWEEQREEEEEREDDFERNNSGSRGNKGHCRRRAEFELVDNQHNATALCQISNTMAMEAYIFI